MSLKLFSAEHCSVDIETLSTKQNGIIVSIGACKFSFVDGVQDTFSVNIKPDNLDGKLHYDVDTLKWWKQQSPEAMAAWKVNPVPAKGALLLFSDWLDATFKDSDMYMWANGMVFDFGLLKNHYETLEIGVPWKYYREMDARTIASLLDFKISKDNKHIAVEDAKNQAENIIKYLKG